MSGAAAPATALVWFKRDLRLRDHAPLTEAARFERALALVILEPQWLASPECHPRQVAYWLAAVAALRADLAARGLPLLLRVGEVTAVLEALRREVGITHLLSHEETGPGWSWARDRAVAAWCRAQGVVWTEWPQTGVVRRLRDRNGWAARWARRMNAPRLPAPRGFAPPPGVSTAQPPLPTLRELGLPEVAADGLPAAGERAAWATLGDFLAGRGRGYRRALSSPLAAETGCSRLSEHLAFGTVSLRCVHQATERRIAQPDGDAGEALAFRRDLRAFSGRLRWHCHFMQKLEDQPDLEFRNLARSVDGLRAGDGVHPGEVDRERLQAWCEGRTGFPMVDACMRQLNATGWLNFRMRAMLVSFSAYHLGLHWREPGLHLARQFLDFEPGIHWSQMQMQSGCTGINTLRIYSPAKQARDQDPTGDYLRCWLPEFGTPAYPAPIVDEREAVAEIKARLHALRQTASARAEADAIQQRHGSRRSGLPTTARPPRRPSGSDPRQGSLF
jgi:deoxyribodipyrimidine photo-lyase